MNLGLTLSNRFEYLLEHLLARLAQESPDPFTPHCIVIPNAAIRRRLELAIADRRGVCANIEFPFLGQWLWQQVGLRLDILQRSPLEPARVTWAIYGLLGDAGLNARHPTLGAYLASADPVMRLELAQRIAQCFDDLLTYRPEWVEAWRLGRPVPVDPRYVDTERWQADLWRALTARLGVAGQHPFLRFLAQPGIAASHADRSHCTHIFCLPALAQLHLELLRNISAANPIHIYANNPCREHWFELVDPRRLSWLVAKGRDQYFETGNRLLSAWGRQTQAHIDLLFSDHGELVESGSAFFANHSRTLLGQLQDAVLDMREPAAGSIPLAAADRSLEIHVCHSLTRELEVLQDRLLTLLAGDAPPHPSEILVVVPDLGNAAPLIDGVFGTAPPERSIPYVITGRAQASENPLGAALLQLIALLPGRMPASAVFDLLQREPVAERYRLDAAALESVRDWIRDSGIRWATDAAHRKSLGLPETGLNTLEDGLDRLFLAYAMGEQACFDARLAAANPEGLEAVALGRFWKFVQDLRSSRSEWMQPRTAAAWRTTLDTLLDRFTADSFGWAEARRSLTAVFACLERDMLATPDPLPCEAVRAALEGLLEQPALGGVPGGGVTFAALASLRGLPYRMICVLGADDGALPSGVRPAEFDLLSHHARRGDRQRRQDERNVFLDLFLSARETLHISYSGRSQRDNSPLPPSVLIAELLEVAAEACGLDLQTPAERSQLVVEHPLQAFSPDAFRKDSDPRLRSHNSEYCEALRDSLDTGLPPPQAAAPEPAEGDEDDEENPSEPDNRGFFLQPLAGPAEAERIVPLEDLPRFFRNPCRALLRNRLGIVLAQADEELVDEEAFLPDWRAAADLADRLIPQMVAGVAAEQLTQLAGAGIEYPPGALGALCLEEEILRIQRYAQALLPALRQTPLAPVPLQLAFALGDEHWQIVGALPGLRPEGIVHHRYHKLSATDRIELWIHHLVLCAVGPDDVVPTSVHHARDQQLVLAPVTPARAQAELLALLSLYRDGQTRPLHFFPRSAWAYIENGESLAAAHKTWAVCARRPFAEGSDPAYRLALRGVANPLDDAFVVNARIVFGSLNDYSGEGVR